MARRSLPVPSIAAAELEAAAERAGIALGAAEAERLAVHAGELRRFDATVPLIGPVTTGELVDRHYLESLRGQELVPAGVRLLDLGSGAGFPGLVLAAVRADLEVHLVEPNPRKAAFLRVAARRMGVRVEVHACRVEGLPPEVGGVGVVTSRALRLTPPMITSLTPRLAPRAALVLWVGRELPLLPGWQLARELRLPGGEHRRIVVLDPAGARS